jgi:hypothetical protein
MPGFKEVQYYLAGLWLLIRMDPAGFRFLDLSERGVNRSFWAFVWCLPPMGISWLWWREAFLQTMPPHTDVGMLFYFRLGLVEAANWFVPLVFAGLLLLAFKKGERFAPVIVAVNWLGVPLSYINGLFAGAGVLRARRHRHRLDAAAGLHAGPGLRHRPHPPNDLQRQRAADRGDDAGAVRTGADAVGVSAAVSGDLPGLDGVFARNDLSILLGVDADIRIFQYFQHDRRWTAEARALFL